MQQDFPTRSPILLLVSPKVFEPLIVEGNSKDYQSVDFNLKGTLLNLFLSPAIFPFLNTAKSKNISVPQVSFAHVLQEAWKLRARLATFCVVPGFVLRLGCVGIVLCRTCLATLY